VQPPLPAVPQGEGEHADEPWQCRLEPETVASLEQHLRVGSPPQRWPGAFDVGTQRREVVALSSVDLHVTPGGGHHRLRTGRGQVHDGQATLGEPHTVPRIGPDALPVRASMGQRIGHAPCEGTKCVHTERALDN